MFWMAVLAAAAFVAGGGWYWWRSRAPAEEARWTCRCPKCDRKIRYPASQAGHYAICPGCKHRVPLPHEDEEGPREHKAEDYRVRRRTDNAGRS